MECQVIYLLLITIGVCYVSAYHQDNYHDHDHQLLRNHYGNGDHGRMRHHGGRRHHSSSSESDTDSEDEDTQDRDHHYRSRRHHSDSEDEDRDHRRHRGHHSSSDSEDEDQSRRHHSESEDDDHQENHHDNHEEQQDERSWRFQIGFNFGAYEYLDDQGYAKGFYIDLMRDVCARANKHCYFVIDSYSHCWNTEGGQELPGVGLLDNYYDGCIGLLPSPDRLNSFNFTVAFTPDVACALGYKAGSTVTDLKNVTGKKIGFVDGWAMSKRCFERQQMFTGNDKGKYEPLTFETHSAMMTALMKNEVNAVMTDDEVDAKTLGLEAVQPSFKCTTAGASVMTMYGSEVIEWWNKAYLDMKHDGSLNQLCSQSAHDHAAKGHINCLLD